MASTQGTGVRGEQTHGDALTPEQVTAAVTSFALLADPTRVRMPWALRDAELDVATLAGVAGCRPTVASQHLSKLAWPASWRAPATAGASVPDCVGGHIRRAADPEALFQRPPRSAASPSTTTAAFPARAARSQESGSGPTKEAAAASDGKASRVVRSGGPPEVGHITLGPESGGHVGSDSCGVRGRSGHGRTRRAHLTQSGCRSERDRPPMTLPPVLPVHPHRLEQPRPARTSRPDGRCRDGLVVAVVAEHASRLLVGDTSGHAQPALDRERRAIEADRCTAVRSSALSGPTVSTRRPLCSTGSARSRYSGVHGSSATHPRAFNSDRNACPKRASAMAVPSESTPREGSSSRGPARARDLRPGPRWVLRPYGSRLSRP